MIVSLPYQPISLHYQFTGVAIGFTIIFLQRTAIINAVIVAQRRT